MSEVVVRIEFGSHLPGAGWIAVSEGFPEKRHFYLCWFGPFGGQEVMYWEDGKEGHARGWWSDGELVESPPVTHWRELPSPPAALSGESK